MKRTVLSFVTMAFLCFCSVSASSQQKVIHSLSIAAHPSINFTNDEADKIISKMNQTIASTSFPWDMNCPDVEFVRSGSINHNANLLKTGTYKQLVDNLKYYEPKASVLIVTGVNCDGVQAAGCGFIGAEPIVVGLYPNYNDQLWLHERGHNVGLKHAAEGPETEDDFPENVGKRFMFWMLGLGHVGKISDECKAFKTASFSSVSQSSTGATVLAAAAVPVDAAAPMVLAQAADDLGGPSSLGVQSGSQSPPDYNAQINALAKEAGLTVKAFKLVSAPWVDGAPVKAIQKLDDADLNSLRAMLKGEPNDYWAQAISILGIAGNKSDVEIIKNALERPAPAVMPGMEDESKQALRSFARIKLAAPLALGVLANRTQSTSAVDVLKNTANEGKSASIAGADISSDVSKNALSGLSVANMPASKEYMDAVIKLQGPFGLAVPASPIHVEASRAPALSQEELKRLSTTSKEVDQQGIEAFINNKKCSWIQPIEVKIHVKGDF